MMDSEFQSAQNLIHYTFSVPASLGKSTMRDRKKIVVELVELIVLSTSSVEKIETFVVKHTSKGTINK